MKTKNKNKLGKQWSVTFLLNIWFLLIVLLLELSIIKEKKAIK